MKEIKFDCLNKDLEEYSPRDYDAVFIAIGCDVINACGEVVRAMVDADIVKPEDGHKEQINLFKTVIETLEEMLINATDGETDVS